MTDIVVREEQPKAIIVVRQALEDRTQDLLAVLPESMGGTPEKRAERFIRVSLMAVSKNPDILVCTPSSIVRSIIEAAEVGLEPTGSLNRAWLVPFRKNQDSPQEAQLMIGYQGYADLMRDSGRITRVTAEVVYRGDTFKVVKGTSEPRIEHEPAYITDDPADITHAYAVAWFTDGSTQSEVMPRSAIELIRAKSRGRNGKAWVEGYPQMCRKSAIRRLSNYVPLSARAASAIQRDDEHEFGDAASPVVESRTASVRASIRARRLPAPEAPGAPEEAEVVSEPMPEESASQQSPVNATVATAGVASATAAANAAEEICGAQAQDGLMVGAICILAPDHKEKYHQSADGSWPR